MKHCEGIITKNVKFKGLKKGSKQRRDEQREDEEDFFRFEEGIQNPKKNNDNKKKRVENFRKELDACPRRCWMILTDFRLKPACNVKRHGEAAFYLFFFSLCFKS